MYNRLASGYAWGHESACELGFRMAAGGTSASCYLGIGAENIKQSWGSRGPFTPAGWRWTEYQLPCLKRNPEKDHPIGASA